MSISSSATDMTVLDETVTQRGGNTASSRQRRGASKSKKRFRKRTAVAGVSAIAALSIIAALSSFSAKPEARDSAFIYHTVQKRDLPITVTERGSLESQNDAAVLCEVDDVHGDGVAGTPVLWLIPNGSEVKKGDLLVELDTSSHLERLDKQVLATDRARSWQIRATVLYKNRVSRNKTLLDKANIDVQLAKLALQQYEDEHGGTFQIALQDIELAIQRREAEKEIDTTNRNAAKHLAELGYKSKGDLAQAELKALRAETALNREIARRKELVKYTYVRTKKKLQGALESAERHLVQVGHDNEALLIQAKSAKDSADRQLAREEERLARYRDQLEKCKIYAPAEGMVAYAVASSRWGSSSTIAEGEAVRDRQRLMTLPDLKHMQVKTAVHESVVNRIKTGLKATIRVDAFPERTYSGKVTSVAVLPDPGGWLASNTKVYQTILTIDGEVDQLKPGMTAVAEMHVARLIDTICIPVQGLIQRGSEIWCYVVDAGTPTKRIVEVGRTNDKMIEITRGLSENEVVILNPSAVLDDAPAIEPGISPEKERVQDVSLE